MYFEPSTGKSFALHSEVRNAMPWRLFSDSISDQDLAAAGVFPLASDRPDVEHGQIAVPVGIEEVDGQWTQLWSVREMTPEDLAASSPPVPQEVTMRQARLALLAIGKLNQVAPAIESLTGADRDIARIEWEFSSAVVRSRSLVVMLGHVLGLDDEALDQLFITAARL